MKTDHITNLYPADEVGITVGTDVNPGNGVTCQTLDKVCCIVKCLTSLSCYWATEAMNLSPEGVSKLRYTNLGGFNMSSTRHVLLQIASSSPSLSMKHNKSIRNKISY